MNRNRILPRSAGAHTYATELRSHATPQENRLWYDFLRGYAIRFNRQRVIGAYIVDFYCAKAQLAVELDGNQHYEEQGMKYDAARTAFLEALGIKVLRFTNLDIAHRFAGVCEMIDCAVKERMR